MCYNEINGKHWEKRMNTYPLYLFHQGTNFKAYEYLGAHPARRGTVFRVWAPNARRVRVIGSFNGWAEDSAPALKRISEGGVWEGTVRGAKEGDTYKFLIDTADGRAIYKADPYAFFSETEGGHASVVYDFGKGFAWTDDEWRSEKKDLLHSPVNIYEVHLGSWMREADGSYMSYRKLAKKLVSYVKKMQYTHVELLPVSEHPYDGSWGYQTSGYYSVTGRFGRPEDFAYLVDCFHAAGIGVFLDWVPAHFVKDDFGLIEFDGQPLYEYQGADRMEHKGWGTRVFDHGRCEVQSFLISNADFWLDIYHIDGLRVDAVASMIYLDYDKKPGEWVPNIYGDNKNLESIAFLRKLNGYVAEKYPNAVMIAEESTAFPGVTQPVGEGGLGFSYKWNMGWMNDVLDYVQCDPFFRKDIHGKLTFSFLYCFSEHYILPISHDEVVHGKKSLLDKMFGEYDQKFANFRAFLVYMTAHPGKKLLFMGCEFGQFIEWDEKKQLDWILLKFDKHRRTQQFVKKLNEFYRNTPALYEIDDSWEGFRWVSCDDNTQNILSFFRFSRSGKEVLVVLNFAPVQRDNFLVGAFEGIWRLVFNTDAKVFGGTGTRTPRTVRAKKREANGYSHSIRVRIPPMCALVYERAPEKMQEDEPPFEV